MPSRCLAGEETLSACGPPVAPVDAVRLDARVNLVPLLIVVSTEVNVIYYI